MSKDNVSWIFLKKVSDIIISCNPKTSSEKSLKVKMACSMGFIDGLNETIDKINKNYFANLSSADLFDYEEIEMLNEVIQAIHHNAHENLAEIDREWQIRFCGLSKPRKPRKDGRHLFEKEVDDIIALATKNNFDTLDEDVLMVAMAYMMGQWRSIRLMKEQCQLVDGLILSNEDANLDEPANIIYSIGYVWNRKFNGGKIPA